MSGNLLTTNRLIRHKFTFLLAALILLLIVSPLTEATRLGGTLYTIGITAVFITGVLANWERKWVFRGALLVAMMAIPLSWTALFKRSAPIDLVQ